MSTPASTFNKPTPSAPSAPKPAPREPSPPPPSPAASRPPPQATFPKPVSASTPAPTETRKPAEDDRIAPVGTAYQPIKLTPGKLGGRWNPGGNRDKEEEAPAQAAPSLKDRMAAFSGGGKPAAPSVGTDPSGGKKLTWSERQAEAKRQREEEEAGSKAASTAGEF